MDDDNFIDPRKLSPGAWERMRAMSLQQLGVPLDESLDLIEVPEDAMRRVEAEAERRGISIYEVIEWLLTKRDA